MRVSNTLLFTTACCAASVFAASSDLTALASAPTACTDFARIDYSSWSQSHIKTWCEEHDPSSTGQCAPVTWPGDVTAPPMAHTHRGLVNWFLHRNPNLGTRKDCIALSMGFQVNTATNKKNGLSETVTCDLYDLGHDRHHECVCFPVYADATSTIRRVGDRDVVTTNTYYPPENVVKRELSSALFRKDPPIYHADYPKTVDLFSRDTKLGGSTLGGFPYCASPAAAIQPRRPPWTATLPTRGQVTMPFGTPTGPTDVCRTVPIIPTGPPTPSPRDKNCKTAWAVESCLWQFIEPYNETRRYWVTYQDIAGNGLFATWSSITISRTEPHWGLNTEDFLDPQTSETEYTTLTSQVVRTDPSGNPIYRTTETTVMPVSDDPSAVSTTATTTVSGGNTIVTTIYVPIPTTTDADWHLSTMTALGSFHRRDRSDRWKRG
ncbi:hypothetical protein M8818_006732 [Zalaria obscura]|uniref:Uncharacterized protein n=1 Tax=Zalaria obscura TaxID=2024903 RepID=A0ACC3S6M4_9PEZI